MVEEVQALARHLHKPLFVIAESHLNDPRLVTPLESGGYGLHAVWADDWHHAVHAALTGESSGYYADFGPIPTLARALRQAWVYDGQRSEHRRRIRGSESRTGNGARFVVSTQNHDQIGNRALGERLGHLTSLARVKAAAALLLTGPFTPMLFQGEEWAAGSSFLYFTDHDEALGQLIADGRRREFAGFGWGPGEIPDPQDPSTFDRSRLDWEERSLPGHREVLEWYRRLLHLRRDLTGLNDPRLGLHSVDYCEDPAWLVVRRPGCLVALSLAGEPCTIPAGDATSVVLASDPALRLVNREIQMPPDCVAVLKAQ
jgi:maltooligosyltrehalose trehalohydrolase